MLVSVRTRAQARVCVHMTISPLQMRLISIFQSLPWLIYRLSNKEIINGGSAEETSIHFISP